MFDAASRWLALPVAILSLAVRGSSSNHLYNNFTTSASNSSLAHTNSSATLSASASIPSGQQSAGSSSVALGSSTSTTGIGDYIASALGLSSSTSTSTPSRESHGTASASPNRFFGSTGITGTGANTTGNGTLPSPTSSGNASHISYNGSCWNQWNEFWSLNNSLTGSGYLVPTTETNIDSALLTIPISSAGTTTITDYDGAFPVTTRTFVTTEVTNTLEWGSGTYTSLFAWTLTETPPNSGITPPPCVLPSIVPQCESSWAYWVSNHVWGVPTVDTPICTQASVSGRLCSGLRSSYLSLAYVYGGGGPTLGDAASYLTINGSTQTSYYWPTSYSLAPGCSLGCADCRITGGSVKLLYWPPATSTAHGGSNATSTSNHTGLVTATGFNTTFTSPTVYISFDSLYASDSCSGIGKTYYNEIVAITDIAHFSSMYGYQRYNHDPIPASFNFTDLVVKPVPDSIYESQPRCASSYFDLQLTQDENGYFPANWTCPRTLPYEPLLSVPMEVRVLDPAWASCGGAVEGVYDPPTALQPAATVAMPTPPPETTPTTTARPASQISPSSAPRTSGQAVPAPTTFTESSSPLASDTPTTPQDSNPSDGTSANPPSTEPTEATPEDSPTTRISTDPSVGATSHGTVASDVQPTSSPNPDPATSAQPSNVPEESTGIDGTTQDADPPSTPTDLKPTPETTNALSILSAAEQSSTAADPDPSPSVGSTDSPGTTPVAVVTIAQDPSNTAAVIVGGQTLSAGGAAHESSGVTISVASGGTLKVGSSAVAITALPAGQNGASTVLTINAQPPTPVDPGASTTFTAGDQVFTAASSSDAMVVNGQTLQVNGPAVTFENQVVSAGATGLVVGTGAVASFVPVAGAEQVSATTFTADGKVYTAQSSSNAFIVNGQTLSPAGPAVTVGGQIISADPTGIAIVSGAAAVTVAVGDAQPIQGAVTSGAQTLVTIASQVYTVLAQTNGVEVFQNSDTTVTVSSGGGPGTVVNGVAVSALSNGIVVGTASDATTIRLGSSDPSVQFVTIGSQTYAVAATSGADIFSNAQTTFTLSADGAATTISGEVVSVASNAGEFVVGSSTYLLATPTAVLAAPSTIAIGSQIFTEVAQSDGADVFANDQTTFTLSPGGSATTIDGHVVSAAASDVVVVGSSSQTVLPKDTTLTIGSAVVTGKRQSDGGDVIVLDSTTITLSPGGPAATIGSEVISEASDGAITAMSRSSAASSHLASSTSTSGANGPPGPLRNAFYIAGLVVLLFVTL